MVINFSQLKGQGLSKILFLCIIIFERIFDNKKLRYYIFDRLGLFFVGCFSRVYFIGPLISSSNILTIKT